MKNVPQPKSLTIKQAISRAKKATKQGKRAVALELYNAVLRHQPNHPVAKKGLRKLQKGFPHKQSVQGETANPSQEQVNTLVNLYHSGLMMEAEQFCRKLLLIYPQSLFVINILGAVLQGLGRLQEAVESYGKAIRLKPDYAEAYFNRGNALKELGQLVLAVESYEKAIQFKPDYAMAYSNRGNVLQELGQLANAMESHDKVIQLKPDYAEAYYNRGNVLQELGQLKQAEKSFEKAIQFKPDFAMAYSNRGNVLQELGQLALAVENHDKAIQLKSDCPNTYYNRGNVLKDLGQFGLAVENYEKAIQFKPDFFEAHRNLSRIKKYKPADSQIAVMENQYEQEKLNESDRIHLSFALAKAYEDLCEYRISFKYLVEGNRLRNKELNYNIDQDIRLYTKIRKIFCAGSLMPEFPSGSNKSIQPIFILGMPRSGTSLVEQILASHTKVYGAGELESMSSIVSPLLSHFPDQNISQEKHEISQNTIVKLRNDYFDMLTALKSHQKVITDKMPLNFRWIGFILSAIPEAKIIHLNRDPVATCWSIYKHYFTGEGNGYAYDMENLAHFYLLYIELMAFWREQHPNNIYDLYYENLTENQEEETRRLFAFCDLDWEEQCLDFHKTKRVVKTASNLQVRKKMYKGSSEAWKKYKTHLKPLINGLRENGVSLKEEG